MSGSRKDTNHLFLNRRKPLLMMLILFLMKYWYGFCCHSVFCFERITIFYVIVCDIMLLFAFRSPQTLLWRGGRNGPPRLRWLWTPLSSSLPLRASILVPSLKNKWYANLKVRSIVRGVINYNLENLDNTPQLFSYSRVLWSEKRDLHLNLPPMRTYQKLSKLLSLWGLTSRKTTIRWFTHFLFDFSIMSIICFVVVSFFILSECIWSPQGDLIPFSTIILYMRFFPNCQLVFLWNSFTCFVFDWRLDVVCSYFRSLQNKLNNFYSI